MLFRRSDIEMREARDLAPYATQSSVAMRAHADPGDAFRTAFQRDRARIIHSKAFRRLKGKTQVFVAHAGDHFRNRLTHTLEVAQISRDLARSLGLNEDLAECIALAHDLGHTPFGHVGEHKMAELLQPYDTLFEHNRQSRRIVTVLEKKYPAFTGLNLTHDVLDGLAKHQTPYDQPDVSHAHWPSLEAQVVDVADEIAYVSHDLDDGLRAGILSATGLDELALWRDAYAQTDASLPTEARVHRTVSRVIAHLTQDLLTATSDAVTAAQIDSPVAVQDHTVRLVQFSSSVASDLAKLREYLFQHFYLSAPVRGRSEAGAATIEHIFTALMADSARLPPAHAARLDTDSTHVVVTDFIAGMTDSYAEDFAARLAAEGE